MNIIKIEKQWLISQPRLINAFDMTRAKFYRLRKSDPTFPKPIKQSNTKQASAHFIVDEIQAWMKTRADERGDVK